jgi:signal transduction histidine kinase
MLGKVMMSAIAVVALAFSASHALAQGQFGTAAEAKALLEKAINELKTNEKSALEKFAKGEGGFKDRDLYVFCFDMVTGKFTAHINPKLMGTDVRALKDPKDGSALGQKIFDMAKEGTITTVSYNFPKPGGTEPVPKESFVTRVGNQGCGVGYYKQ